MLKLECIKKTEMEKLQRQDTLKHSRGATLQEDEEDAPQSPLINRLQTMVTFHMMGGI